MMKVRLNDLVNSIMLMVENCSFLQNANCDVCYDWGNE